MACCGGHFQVILDIERRDAKDLGAGSGGRQPQQGQHIISGGIHGVTVARLRSG